MEAFGADRVITGKIMELDGNLIPCFAPAFKYFVSFKIIGSSNYAFPIILNTKNIKTRDKFEKYLLKNNIEFRRGNAGGGNQLRQPYIKKYIKMKNFSNFKNVEHVHFFGYYIGNYPDLSKLKIKKITKILNKFNFFK
jgi:CDP-6-deoxy-D-xylo-4-hexulose-3-dehydrase